MEFPPEPQEFEWWQVNGRHGHWRMGDRVTVIHDGTSWKIQAMVVGFVLVLFCLRILDSWWAYQAGDLTIERLVSLLAIRALTAIGIVGVAIWYFGKQTVTIDWNKQQIQTQRTFIKRQFPFSSLRAINLSKGPSSAVETSKLRLILENGSVRLLETYHRDDAVQRDALLITLGRRLAETLEVPLQTLGDLDRTISLGLSNEELADKYVSQGESMALHCSNAELRGDASLAEAYREEAKFHFQYAHELDPSNSKCLLELGSISGDADFHRRAIDLAVGHSEENVDALLERGRIHQLDGKTELAESDYNRAVELERSHKTLLYRGVSLYFRDRFEDALRDFEGAIDFEPEDASLHHWRFDCWRRIFLDSNLSRHRQNAIKAIDRAIELDPKNATYMVDRRNLQARKGDSYEEALAELDRLCDEDPSDWMHFKNRADLHLAHGDKLAEAIADFSRVIKLIEKQPMPSGEMRADHCHSLGFIYRLRSDAHRSLGDFVAADRDLETAEKLESQ